MDTDEGKEKTAIYTPQKKPALLTFNLGFLLSHEKMNFGC